MGLLKRMQDKATEIDTEHKLIFIHCIIHEHALCRLVLKLNNVGDAVTKTVNFIWARALNERQLVPLLEKQDNEHVGIRYITAVRWYSLGKVLKRFGT